MKTTLELQLVNARKEQEASAKKVRAIEEKIAKEKEKSKPKKIYEIIKSLSAIYSKLKIDPQKDVLKIQGFDKEDMDVLKGLIERMRICKAYNDGKLPARNRRWCPWHYLNSSGSGLVFADSHYHDDHAYTSSAARLSFVDQESSDAYAKNFMHVEEKIIGL